MGTGVGGRVVDPWQPVLSQLGIGGQEVVRLQGLEVAWLGDRADKDVVEPIGDGVRVPGGRVVGEGLALELDVASPRRADLPCDQDVHLGLARRAGAHLARN